MDIITKALLTEFRTEQGLSGADIPDEKAFEHFCNFVILSHEAQEDFDLLDAHSGGGNDTGLDGLAIFVNGHHVSELDELEDVISSARTLDVKFVFVQAKTGKNFDSGEIGTFLFGVRDFFVNTPQLPRNERVTRAAKVCAALYAKSAMMRNGRPLCKIYYVTTGKWQADAAPVARFEAEKQALMETNILRAVECIPIDADHLQKMYHATKNRTCVEFDFSSRTVLAEIPDVKEAYIGVLPAKEYLRIIQDDYGNILKNLFYDNVRDFQGDNDVNSEIRQTLRDSQRRKRFAVLNNGVTLVAKRLIVVGNKFTMEDYQIVNGCQTSYVLFEEGRNGDLSDVNVPVKVIVTDNDVVTTSIIRSTNSQTQIKAEQLHAVSDFQKKLETYFACQSEPQRLYYERRSRQYAGNAAVERVRVISLQQQIRAFAAMFLDVPHRATRSYSTLVKQIGHQIFAEGHRLEPYYTSAYALYRLEWFFRNDSEIAKYKLARYQILMLVRYLAGGASAPALSANKMENYCAKIFEGLRDDGRCRDVLMKACKIVDSIAAGFWSADMIRTEQFTNEAKTAALSA